MEPGNARAQSGHLAHVLVADDHGGLDMLLGPGVPVINMYVRTADSGFVDLDQHLSRGVFHDSGETMFRKRINQTNFLIPFYENYTAILIKMYLIPQTREKVQRIIDEMHYSPDHIGIQMQSKSIGLVVPDITNPFFADIARAVANRAICDNYVVILMNTDFSEEKELEYISTLIPLFFQIQYGVVSAFYRIVADFHHVLLKWDAILFQGQFIASQPLCGCGYAQRP